MDDHTFDNFTQAQFLPNLLDRRRYDAWEQAGAEELYKRCNTEVNRIISEHQVEPKPDAVIKDIDKMIKAL